jgi:hypothetical protein
LTKATGPYNGVTVKRTCVQCIPQAAVEGLKNGECKFLARVRESFLIRRCLRAVTYASERMTNTRQILYCPFCHFLPGRVSHHLEKGGKHGREQPSAMRLLPIAHRAGRPVGTGEDLRISAQWQRSELFPLSRRPLPRRGNKLLGKAPTGTGNCPDDRASGLIDLDARRFRSRRRSGQAEGGARRSPGFPGVGVPPKPTPYA